MEIFMKNRTLISTSALLVSLAIAGAANATTNFGFSVEEVNTDSQHDSAGLFPVSSNTDELFKNLENGKTNDALNSELIASSWSLGFNG